MVAPFLGQYILIIRWFAQDPYSYWAPYTRIDSLKEPLYSHLTLIFFRRPYVHFCGAVFGCQMLRCSRQTGAGSLMDFNFTGFTRLRNIRSCRSSLALKPFHATATRTADEGIQRSIVQQCREAH